MDELEHEDLVNALLEIIHEENQADLKARAAHLVGNFKRERRYEGKRTAAQEKLFNFLDSVTITKRTEQ